jgi:hypothetical protein
MTILKASALVVALVVAFALGLALRPYVVRQSPENAVATVTVRPAPTVAMNPAMNPTKPADDLATRAAKVTVTPALETRVKPLLKTGADMTLAAEGFSTGEQFAAVAHAANNTDIPFVLLKDRVLNKHMTLAAAIHASRPTLPADVEADRAHSEARSDVLATLRGVV